jgi:putative DNA primase/helicase
MGATAVSLHEIVARVGGNLMQGGTAAVVPGPGHRRHDRSLSLRIGHGGRLLWHSFAGDDPEMISRHLGVDLGSPTRLSSEEYRRLKAEREAIARREAERTRAFCAGLWAETQPAERSIVESYLTEARLIRTPVPAVIRFHPAAPLDYERKRCAPGMVAVVQDDRGAPCGLHVTALQPDGSGKASFPNPRRMFGDIAEGAVRLAPVGPDRMLAIGEGIETSASYGLLKGVPVWAALSSSLLKRFVMPKDVDTLMICADGDKPGREAAAALGERASRRADVLIDAAPEGRDWNDVLLESPDV